MERVLVGREPTFWQRNSARPSIVAIQGHYNTTTIMGVKLLWLPHYLDTYCLQNSHNLPSILSAFGSNPPAMQCRRPMSVSPHKDDALLSLSSFSTLIASRMGKREKSEEEGKLLRCLKEEPFSTRPLLLWPRSLSHFSDAPKTTGMF